MRRVVNRTQGRVIVEWLKPDGKWETIANLSPDMSYESHQTFYGAIRVGAYDDRDFKERPDITVHVFEHGTEEKE